MMSNVQYSMFEAFQGKILVTFINNFEKTPIEIDSVFGNELFQRMMDAAFLVFEKYDKALQIKE